MIPVTILILICSILISVFPRVDSYRDRRKKGFWRQIKPKGRFILITGIILLILQVIHIRLTNKEIKSTTLINEKLNAAVDSLNIRLLAANEFSDSLQKQLYNLNESTNKIHGEINTQNILQKEEINLRQSDLGIRENRIEWKTDGGEQGVSLCYVNKGDVSGIIKKVIKYLVVEDSLGSIFQYHALKQTIPQNTKIYKTDNANDILCAFHEIGLDPDSFENQKMNVYLYVKILYSDEVVDRIKTYKTAFIWRYRTPIKYWYFARDEEKVKVEQYLSREKLI
jgi:hypothetical protein